jgi:hypothetical protein
MEERAAESPTLWQECKNLLQLFAMLVPLISNFGRRRGERVEKGKSGEKFDTK